MGLYTRSLYPPPVGFECTESLSPPVGCENKESFSSPVGLLHSESLSPLEGHTGEDNLRVTVGFSPGAFGGNGV